jgi:hypothetical protein
LSYLADLLREGYIICEPNSAPLFTVEDTGDVVMEFQEERLAIKLTSATVASLADLLDDARRREAAALVDDAALYPPHG